MPPPLSLAQWRASVSAWEIGSSPNILHMDICVKVWLLATVGVPSQAVIASVLDYVESEVVRLEEVTSFKIYTKGLGTERRKVWGKYAVNSELVHLGSAEEDWDVMENKWVTLGSGRRETEGKS